MNKREQVFVSSTYEDLKEARDTVIFGLLEADCFPAGMELFPASNASQWELIKSIIDDSDYYLLIIAGRYGSVDETGISYTEKEFDYAVATNKPIVVFAHKSPESLPGTATDQNDGLRGKLASFREKACTGRTVKFWTQKEELPGMAAMALNNLRKFNPAVGWVRGDKAMTPEVESEIADLKTRLVESESKLHDSLEQDSRPMFDDLASGDADVEIEYHATSPHSYGGVEGQMSMTWNEILAIVGPGFITGGNDRDIATRLEDKASEKHKGSGYYDFSVPHRIAEGVRIQFVALGILTNAVDNSGRISPNHWMLTPRGRNLFFGLRAHRGPGTARL
ncbi:DUF4062 domain-containing protein [Glutamicibacter nicotianae]|uniref:DUF4062 domain-containing protein n=1 Tax=Glutamicibacter nicotianae TaxID=37929 RepID=UPI00167F4CBD|nr:DUF4062 domain-containing protein [Glutamicibacter nicotianae]